ncbi:hypothetical protein [Brevibacillus dissolubilis]|uniref:hypothetical protein n=1 Tax=Brevibacillus dissolubilis TaxID=1844116 RepID=UPI00111691CF|nr:hypothetical protein [Brevibacillus dissolubilis]
MMKKFTILSALGALVLTAGISGVSAAATTTTDQATTSTVQTAKAPWGLGQKQMGDMKVRGGFNKGAIGGNNTELLTLLNLDDAALKEQLQAGKSLAEIAEAQGVTQEALIELLTKQNNERLDQALTDGKLTSEQASEMKTQFATKATEMIEKTGLDRGPGEHGGFGGRGGVDSEELATLFNLDQNALKEQLQAGKSLAQIAEAQGVTKQAVIDLLTKQNSERLDQAVTDGKLTSEQAAEMKTQFATKATEMIEKTGLDRGEHGGFGGHGGFASEELATLLNLDQDALKEQLQSGKSLAEIAEAQGVTKQAVIDLLVSEHQARLDQAVTDGKLTAEKAAEMKTDMETRVTEMVENKGYGKPEFKKSADAAASAQTAGE